jgi:hypothetical protein
MNLSVVAFDRVMFPEVPINWGASSVQAPLRGEWVEVPFARVPGATPRKVWLYGVIGSDWSRRPASLPQSCGRTLNPVSLRSSNSPAFQTVTQPA